MYITVQYSNTISLYTNCWWTDRNDGIIACVAYIA